MAETTKKKNKERIDVLLVEQGYFPSREKAQAAILAGIVYQEEQRIEKAGDKVLVDANIIVRGNTCPYVGRGGLKLEKALTVFNIDARCKVAMDIGASTGGFTDCMLQNGASKVYAVDVGHGQLDWKLRNDSRVICMEKVNIRYLEDTTLIEAIDLITIDVSFISLGLVFPKAFEFLSPLGDLVALIKPQFEAGRTEVGKGGIVRDLAIHEKVIKTVVEKGKSVGLHLVGLEVSPIKGGKGNVEYLGHFRKVANNTLDIDTSMGNQWMNEKIKEGGLL